MSKTVETFDIIVVGSGPSGISTALHLQKQAPELAGRTLVVEKARHPRHKLCGGGLTPVSQLVLYKLGIDLDLPFVPIHEIRLRFEGRDVVTKEDNAILIVRRDKFDAALVAGARERGLEIREGVAVTALEIDSEGVTLITDQGQLRARAVVGADGAKSIVRRQIDLKGPTRVCRAIEVLTPEDADTTPEFRDHRIVCDFSAVAEGLQGYAWDFPSVVDGNPYMNRGVFDSRVLPDFPNADLKEIFTAYLGQRSLKLEDYKLMGNPGRWFDPEAQFAVPRVLMVGDAAGIEPLGGDGIGCSLWYGEVATTELIQAFETGNFSFTGYGQRLLSHDLGRFMSKRTRQARFIYRLHNRRLLRGLWWYMDMSARIRRIRAHKWTSVS